MVVILSVFASILVLSGPSAKVVYGPKLHDKKQASCDEFSQFARFNPKSVLGSDWFVFYYWASYESRHTVYSFHEPTKEEDEILHEMLDGRFSVPVNWTAVRLVMVKNQNRKALLVERNDRGHYWLYARSEPGAEDNPGENYKLYDVRLKQKGGYIGMMNCYHRTMHVMSRVSEVPPKHKLQDAAATMGFRMPGGRSYLAEGDRWMPVPDAEPEEVRVEDYLEQIRAARAGEL